MWWSHGEHYSFTSMIKIEILPLRTITCPVLYGHVHISWGDHKSPAKCIAAGRLSNYWNGDSNVGWLKVYQRKNMQAFSRLWNFKVKGQKCKVDGRMIFWKMQNSTLFGKFLKFGTLRSSFQYILSNLRS